MTKEQRIDYWFNSPDEFYQHFFTIKQKIGEGTWEDVKCYEIRCRRKDSKK